MEVKDTRGGGSSSPPLLPFGLFVEQSIARSNSNSSCVCLINLKMMTTDTHGPYNCRILFLSRLALGVSRMSFNSWDIHLARTEEIRVSGMSVLFHIYPGWGVERKGYACMYVLYTFPEQTE